MSATREAETLREWRESAGFWEKHAQTIRPMFALVTEALIKDAGLVKGHKVLDVATILINRQLDFTHCSPKGTGHDRD